MTNKEILKRAIEKAQKNGYKLPRGLDDAKLDIDYLVEYAPSEMIIFSHSFAQAFWKQCSKIGDDPEHNIHWIGGETHWQYHLQQLVLEKQRLKYIEKFL